MLYHVLLSSSDMDMAVEPIDSCVMLELSSLLIDAVVIVVLTSAVPRIDTRFTLVIERSFKQSIA